MKIVIASKSPVKAEAVQRGFKKLFPDVDHSFECVAACSGVSDQPITDEEVRRGAHGRVRHARELTDDADFYVGLEGGVEELSGDFYNFGWVVVESRDHKKGLGRTIAFALPSAIIDLMINEGLEQSHATDKALSTTDTKTETGTIGHLTNNALTYTDWYESAVICALLPFVREDLYPNTST